MLSSSRNLLQAQSLMMKLSRNKISFKNPQNYNLRWQFKWRTPWYSYPSEPEPTHVKKPEDSNHNHWMFWQFYKDVLFRSYPTIKMAVDRMDRWTDPFNMYFLTGSSLLFYQFTHISSGFTVLSILPWALMYTRIRDKTKDPDMKETFEFAN